MQTNQLGNVVVDSYGDVKGELSDLLIGNQRWRVCILVNVTDINANGRVTTFKTDLIYSPVFHALTFWFKMFKSTE